jgi:cytochrome P450
MLGRMMLHLATQPEHRRQLSAQPELTRNFIDEALRIYPIGESFRFVTHDVEVDGCPLKRGDRISVHWPAVNRDPRAVAHPTEMDLRNPAGPLLAFGYGVHFCIGMHLARHDMEIALRTWLRRIPEFGLDPKARITERIWGGAGLHALPLRWPA